MLSARSGISRDAASLSALDRKCWRRLCALLIAVVFCGGRAIAADLPYQSQFQLSLRASEPVAEARIRIVQPDARLKELKLNMPPGVYSDVSGQGSLRRNGDVLTWEVPKRGGELRYRVRISHERDRHKGNQKGHDAWVGPGWALFRADDVFPAAQATLRPGAQGHSELRLDLPAGWSVQTPYLPDAANRLRVSPRGRSFERPIGWILAGRIGSRKDDIGPMAVRIAAPVDGPAPRVPALALLRGTLPVIQGELESLPGYLLIVMAGEPMWRGGLSAPNSLYLHRDRPLISENGTSTLVHELMHVLAPLPVADEHDWIDEGLAEYLGLRVLRDSDSISRERFDHAIEVFRTRGAGVRSLLGRSAWGDVRARAVAVFSDLDRELQQRSGGRHDIFDIVRSLMRETKPADLDRLRQIAAGFAGGPVRALERLPLSR